MSENWTAALDKLWYTNRVHVGPDTSQAYRDLMTFYDHCHIYSFDTGESCQGWEIPPAWEVHKATLTAPDGQVIYDYSRDHPLGLFTYSPSFRGAVTLEELKGHLFSLPKYPDRTGFHFSKSVQTLGCPMGIFATTK